MFSATFYNISAISWRSVLLVEETGVPGENHRPIAIKKICAEPQLLVVFVLPHKEKKEIKKKVKRSTFPQI